MLIHVGINNSVLYIDHLQNVDNKVIPYWVFFHTRSKALAQFDAKKKIYVAGLAFTVTNKYHIKDNLRSLQSTILAHNRHT